MVPVDEVERLQGSERWRWLLVMLVPAGAFIALLAFGLLRSAPSGIKGGSPAPDFQLPMLDGGGTLSSTDLRGKPVVLNFWASWCLPCREEAPRLQRAWERYKSQGVTIVGVNIKDAKSDAKKFVKEFGITYPIVRDENSEFADKLGVYGLPETFFVDHTWRLLVTAAGESQQDEQRNTVVLGAISKEQLNTNIDILLRRTGTDG
jgi:cytochrome c biogenesis protein CcmG/thiol:disulfide interchange protein DsbE